MRKISIIIPAYMEKKNLPKLAKQLDETLRENDFEVIIVNDGNLDGSVQTINELEKEYVKMRGLFFSKRRGKTKAIKDGFEGSRGEIIVIMDADLQYSPEDIPRLIGALGHADVTNGLRTNRKDGIIRILESKIYNLFVQFFFGMRFRDCNSGLKVFKRKVMEDIVDQLGDGWHRYLLVLAIEKGYKVIEIPIRHYPRTAGRPKFPSSPLKLVKGFYDLLSVKAFTLKHKTPS
jgi:dolichol-phosphate mannosyltransferase